MVVAYTWTLHNRGPTVSPIWASQQVHMIHTSLPVLCEARSRELRFASPGMVQTDGGLFCFSYTGKRSSTNMVIIDVKMLSGFLPVKSSLDKVNYRSKIKWVTPGTKEKTGHDDRIWMKTKTWLIIIHPQALWAVCMVALSSLLECPIGSCEHADFPALKTWKGSCYSLTSWQQ